MKTFRIGKKTAVAISRKELSRECGFDINDYVTLVLAVKQMYKKFDLVVAEFEGELFACEGLTIDPLGAVPLIEARFSDHEEEISLFRYCTEHLRLSE